MNEHQLAERQQAIAQMIKDAKGNPELQLELVKRLWLPTERQLKDACQQGVQAKMSRTPPTE
jgi:hypothetical protein